MAVLSPSARSTKFLRDRGYRVANVEKWISFPDKATGRTVRMRQDAFGAFDLVCVNPEHVGTLYVQTTTRANQAARRNKILLSPDAPDVLRSGNRIHVHGWAQVGERGKRKIWEVFVFEAKLENGKVNFYPLLEEEAF
jgi:hypothetical protein